VTPFEQTITKQFFTLPKIPTLLSEKIKKHAWQEAESDKLVYEERTKQLYRRKQNKI
jgi:hypothetical protein